MGQSSAGWLGIRVARTYSVGLRGLSLIGPRARRRGLMTTPRGVSAMLDEWSRGNRSALNQLLPLVYAELRRIAARQLRRERADHTLQPTALVHEVYLRLVDQRQVDWQNRAHFFGVAAQVMRRILVDHARRHGAGKRGDGVRCVSIDEAKEVAASNEIPILALDHALDRLEKVDADLARIVELRAFGGLTIEEAAHVLKVSPSTAKRDWRTAKAGSIVSSAPRLAVTDERWQRVKAMFQAAVERPAAERDAFLAAAAGDDEALRREVESLLASDAADAGFLDRLPDAERVRRFSPAHRVVRDTASRAPHPGSVGPTRSSRRSARARWARCTALATRS